MCSVKCSVVKIVVEVVLNKAKRYINVCENVADYIFVQDIEDCRKYFVCINGIPKSQQCRTGFYFNDTEQACVASHHGCLQCPTSRIINLPLAKTCDKYIFCYYGQALLRKCENNRQFNVKTGKCDLAKNVDCVENRCSIYTTDKDLVYVPSATSCENYYICQAGKAKLFNCADGLYFNTACNCCDNSENVKCLANDAIETQMENTHNLYSKLNHTPPTLVGESDKIKCPPKGYFLYQYIENPQYYFTCVNGKAYFYACGSGFQFDNKLKHCTGPEKQEQLNLNITEYHNTELVANNCPEFGTQLMPHVEDNKYIYCENGNATIFDCPENHYFDVADKLCQHKIKNNFTDTIGEVSETEPGSKCPLKGKMTLPHAQSNQYYLCEEGKAVIVSCALGLYYEDDLKSCTINTTTELTPIGFTCDADYIFDFKTNSCQRNLSLAVNSGNQTPTVLNEPVHLLCPPTGAIKFVHKNKNKFYLCINGMASILACADGSFFDAETETCRRTFDLQKGINVTATETNIAKTDGETSIECPILGTFIYPHIEKNLYYVCLEGKSIVFTCPVGSTFDSNKKTCSASIENQPTGIAPDDILNITCPALEVQKFSHVNKSKFYLCTDGIATIQDCVEGDYFDAKTQICRKTLVIESEDNQTKANSSNNFLETKDKTINPHHNEEILSTEEKEIDNKSKFFDT